MSLPKIYLLCGFVLLGGLTHGQKTFQRTYGTAIDDMGNRVVPTQDGGYILSSLYKYIVKVDSLGNKQWSDSLSCPYVQNIIQTKDGGYLLCGGSVYTNSMNVPYLIKLNSAGSIDWQNVYKSYYASYILHTQEDIGSSGYIAVGNDYGGYLMIMKTTSAGNPVWIQTMKPKGTFSNYPVSHGFVQLKSDSGILVLSTFRYGGSKQGVLLTRFDKNGSGLWTKSLITAGMSQSWPFGGLAIKQIYNGNVMISFIAGSDMDFMEMDINGNPVGPARRYSGLFSAYDVTEWDFSNPKSDKSMYVGTSQYFPYKDEEIIFAKTDSAGNFTWARSFGGLRMERFSSVVTDRDSGAIIVGSTRSFSLGGEDVYLIKTNRSDTLACYGDSVVMPALQHVAASDTNFYCTYAQQVFYATPWNFSITHPKDTSYDACGCVPPKADFDTQYPQPTMGYIKDNSTWATGWFWDYGNGHSDSSMYPNPQYTVNGTYTICLTVKNACGSDSVCKPINFMIIGVPETLDDHNLVITPNPASSVLRVLISAQIGSVEQINIFDVMGRPIMELKNYRGETEINISEFMPGVYYLKVSSAGGYVIRKFVKL